MKQGTVSHPKGKSGELQLPDGTLTKVRCSASASFKLQLSSLLLSVCPGFRIKAKHLGLSLVFLLLNHGPKRFATLVS